MNERIKKVRKSLELTQQEFAERIGMKRNSIALIENGRNTSDQTVFAICREFNVNEEWLRNGQGEMFIEMGQDEQIAAFIGGVLHDRGDSFKKRYISMLASLDESEWKTLEKILTNCNK